MDNPGTNLSLAGACRQGGKLTMSLFVLLAICLLGRPAEAQYGGGTGEPNDPYLIYTAEQMNAIGANPNDWDKHFKLMADIDLSRYTGTSFNIIGYFLDRYDKKPFSGVFEGNGHTISNFSYTSTDRNYIGLFGCIDGENAEIRDLGVIEPNVVARTSSGVGSLVGTLKEGTITNCYAKAGSVVCLIFVGGLVGENSGKIANCYASGGVEGTIAGGLVGINQGIIGNCYSSGEVSGHRKIGGLVGRNGAYPPPSAGTITNCYSVSSVTGTTDVGGMVGLNDGDMVTDSFWDTLTSGQATSACGTGLTTAEMQMQSTFIDAGWDFVNAPDRPSDIWCICDGTNYPRFVWQIHVGDFVCPDGVTMVDFSLFATYWLDDNCDPNNDFCDCTDLDASGKVDFNDLREFAENWLAEGMWISDIIVVDDFESYNDLAHIDPESNRIYRAWLDGNYNPAKNGSVIGHDKPPFTEQNIVHGGSQSMPYFYNTSFKFSKAELPLSPPQDWTREGVVILSLWFHGNASNAAAPMSVVLNGTSAVYHDNPNAVQIDVWTEWIIDLEAFAGVDLTDINSIAICFGEENNPQPGGSGIVYFDDIRLYRPGCK